MSDTRRMTCLRTDGKAPIRTRTSSRTLTEQFCVHTFPALHPSQCVVVVVIIVVVCDPFSSRVGWSVLTLDPVSLVGQKIPKYMRWINFSTHRFCMLFLFLPALVSRLVRAVPTYFCCQRFGCSVELAPNGGQQQQTYQHIQHIKFGQNSTNHNPPTTANCNKFNRPSSQAGMADIAFVGCRGGEG